MPVRQATVASRVGLHARPASLFVAGATKLGVPETIQVGERPAVDARYVAKVPVNEVSEGLRYLLDHLEDEDDGEDDEE